MLLLPGNVLQKRVRTFGNDQMNHLFWSHSFVLAYRILASEIIIFWLFLYLKESLVATFSEKCAHTSWKYLTEQGMGVVKWSEKKLKNLYFWGYLPKAETVECVQNNLNVSEKFGTFITCSLSCCLEVNTCL